MALPPSALGGMGMKTGGAAIMAAVVEAAEEARPEKGGPEDEDESEITPSGHGGETYVPTDPDEQRRAYVFATLANSSYETMPALEAMAIFDTWLKTGERPAPKEDVKPGSKLAAYQGGKK